MTGIYTVRARVKRINETRLDSEKLEYIPMASRAAKLEQLRRLKKARSGVLSDSEDDNDGVIYDEVDESTYRDHKRKQMMEDDFVVDDDGEGYVDTGADEWDDATRPNYDSDDEDKPQQQRKRKKATKVAKSSSHISNFFKPLAATAAAARPQAKVDANIDDILNDFGGAAPKRMKKDAFTISKQKLQLPTPQAKSLLFFSMKKRKTQQVVTDDFDDDSAMDVDDVGVEEDTPPLEPMVAEEEETKPMPLSPVKVLSPPATQESESDSDDDIVVVRPRAAAVAPRPKMSTISSIKANVLQLSPIRGSTEAVGNKPKVLQNAVTQDGSFKMFWIDYSVADNTLLLYGKILTNEGKLVSGVVQVNDIHRELYFLPKEGYDVKEVYEDVVPTLQQTFELSMIKAKPETMKYAFEIPDIPQETEYLKVLLPFKLKNNYYRQLPIEPSGRTYSHVFGKSADIFEEFILQRNIMGPCWLEIKGGDFNALQNSSHCQLEVALSSPKLVTPITNNAPPAPPLKLMSLSVQTKLDEKSNNQEIIAVTMSTYKDVSPEAHDNLLTPSEVVTLCRPVDSQVILKDLEARAKKTKFNLRTFPNEKALLNVMVALIKNADPDVFIGYNLLQEIIEVLTHRLRHHNVTLWSALGRRNRRLWPQRFGGNSKSTLMQTTEVFAGRLLCDIAGDLGRSLSTKCTLWELSEMYRVVCGKQYAGMEVNWANMSNPDYFMTVLKENKTQAEILAEIASVMQILSLLMQLTNIAGNAWEKTLEGTRSGRNESILLHEFRRNNYILPDKGGAAVQQAQQARVDNEPDDATTQTRNKKPKFIGGLVFEPEKGLHQNYTLVMDFNSLYPSIIQEFNICFTTVARDDYNRTHDEQNDMPSYPERDQNPGILPKLLNTLVLRRREVKKLLKDPKLTPQQRAQFDVKQTALKLTANSMYGCLGYVQSRFYAKPLAMLVTNKGREILMDTRQLAELEGLKVVYGDTDSVMINSGCANYKDAVKIGNDFKGKVNEKYKLLEIDIDNVFKRLLLHAKKKYAAMNVTYDKELDTENLKLEVKGLDLVRREYCQLSKDVSTFILGKILGEDDDHEQLLQTVYDYLENLSQEVRANKIRPDKFRINKQLSKDPEKYNDAKSQPHVQVGLRLKKQGKVIKANSVISYIITAPTADNTNSTENERARAFQEVISNKEAGYSPDPNYYLEKQILNPVQRLLEAVDGVDIVRVAECLGLDGTKFAHREAARHAAYVPMEANLKDEERFLQCLHFVVTCTCGKRFRFGGIQSSPDYKVGYNGVSCALCNQSISGYTLAAQLEYAIRRHLAAYYAGWLRCNDALCNHRTRQIGVYGRRCHGTVGCKGVMRYEYTDRDLYNQLLYFSSLFDVDKAKKGQLKSLDIPGVEALPHGSLEALAEQNRELFTRCTSVPEKYLSNCGRRYVNMGSIFNFLQV